jgi:hypothetical protein
MQPRRIAFAAIILVSLLTIATTSAFATTESGRLSGPGKSDTFTVNAESVQYLEVPFTYPAGSADFWVKVVGEDGRTVLGDFDLDNGEIINLSGGGTFYLTIYSKSGSGKWSATYDLNSPVVNNNPFITTESGFLSGPKKSYTFTVNAGDITYLEVPFTYPAGSADFWVKVIGQDGRTVLGDFDLDNGEIIQLSGGGTFYLTIYSKSGSGNWSATYDLSPAEAKKFGITESGYLSGPGKSDTFTVNAGSVQYLEVPFTYPVGPVEFWVKVVGEDGRTVLGDFNLDNGYVIQLSGGGIFYLTIYSKMGAGKWSATY